MIPFFSIITVTKNTEEKIDKTIKSILSQSYKNFEYIIVDGHSKDETLDKIQGYKDKKIKIFCRKDKNFYDGLNWLDELPKPTKEELDSQWIDIQANIAANAYKAQRAAEYPSIPDQLDLLYHGGMDAWKAAIQVVKDKYPKGTA